MSDINRGSVPRVVRRHPDDPDLSPEEEAQRSLQRARIVRDNARADVASGILRTLDYQDSYAYRAAYLAALEALEAEPEPF